ncbi:sulfite exporter TauE/SafE family protein [Acidithiobacillus sp. MC6.1]|nr:sulfite exporter TauE/SafE family protein [Acidithiobacillus sp. MC6.1]
MVIHLTTGEVWRLAVLFAAGTGAGFINVLASGGSMLTLPILIFSGLDPVAANATNRIGILMENVTATYAFHHRGLVKIGKGSKLALWAIPGAVLGAITSVHISNLWFQRVLVIILILSIVTIFLPRRVSKGERPDGHASPWLYPAMMGLGFYGGFIQLGAGFLLITALHHLLTSRLAQINAYKTLIISLYTLPAILVYGWMGQIRWERALAITMGGMVGAWLASRLALGRRGELLVKMVLAIMVLLMAAKLWI